jgi:hypothetical protein
MDTCRTLRGRNRRIRAGLEVGQITGASVKPSFFERDDKMGNIETLVNLGHFDVRICT